MVDIMGDAVTSTVGRSELLLTPHGGPERLFRIGPVSIDAGVVRLSMGTGPWLDDGDHRPAAGALGVLFDDLLGQAVIAHRPAGCWGVTTELAIDVGGPLPADGSVLYGEAELVSVDAAGGLGRGTVRDTGGTAVAVGTTWTRFVPGVPESIFAGSYGPATVRGDVSSLCDLIGADGSGATVVLPDRPDLVNPAGRVHGGVVACAAECAARRAVAGSGLATASLRVTYVRPAVAPVEFSTTVLHGGRSLAVVEVVAHGGDGRTCAIATAGLRSPLAAAPQ
jgi:uncharacterized protein (TIGR00369 family)